MKNAVWDETSVSNDTLYGSSHHKLMQDTEYRIAGKLCMVQNFAYFA